jgi:hypothetical protein
MHFLARSVQYIKCANFTVHVSAIFFYFCVCASNFNSKARSINSEYIFLFKRLSRFLVLISHLVYILSNWELIFDVWERFSFCFIYMVRGKKSEFFRNINIVKCVSCTLQKLSMTWKCLLYFVFDEWNFYLKFTSLEYYKRENLNLYIDILNRDYVSWLSNVKTINLTINLSNINIM